MDSALRSAYPHCSDDVLDSNVLKERNSIVTKCHLFQSTTIVVLHVQNRWCIRLRQCSEHVRVRQRHPRQCPLSSGMSTILRQEAAERWPTLARSADRPNSALARAWTRHARPAPPLYAAISNAHLDGGDSWPEMDATRQSMVGSIRFGNTVPTNPGGPRIRNATPCGGTLNSNRNNTGTMVFSSAAAPQKSPRVVWSAQNPFCCRALIPRL